MPFIFRRPVGTPPPPPPVLTPTLWVNSATGSDANTRAAVRAGGGSVQWQTIGRAAWGSTTQGSPNTAEAADAGDVVSVAAGTYSGPGKGSRLDPCFNPANSGTVSNRIIFLASGTVTLQLSSGAGPTFGAYLRNYITWRGFTCAEANAPSLDDTGVCVLWDCTGSWIEYAVIDGNGVGHGVATNHNGVRLEAAVDGVVRNCKITNVYTTAPNPNNAAAIMEYKSDRCLIEHNEIWNSGCGIFLKGGPNTAERPGHTLRFNLVHDIQAVGIAAYAGTPASAAEPCRIHQNIVYNCGAAEGGLRYWMFDDHAGFNDPTNTHFLNNTVYNCGYGLEFVGTCSYDQFNLVYNNIFSTQSQGIDSPNTATYHGDHNKVDQQHNVYTNTSGNMARLNGGGTTLTLAQWQASPYTQDATSPAAVTTDPGFTNAAGHDFHIVSGYALTQGRAIMGVGGADGTTIPAGAYITGSEVIGVEP